MKRWLRFIVIVLAALPLVVMIPAEDRAQTLLNADIYFPLTPRTMTYESTAEGVAPNGSIIDGHSRNFASFEKSRILDDIEVVPIADSSSSIEGGTINRNATRFYQQTPAGIFLVGLQPYSDRPMVKYNNRPVLINPIKIGTVYKSDSYSSSIEDLYAVITAPYGHFTDCIRVKETNYNNKTGDIVMETTTWYAPKIGPVKVIYWHPGTSTLPASTATKVLLNIVAATAQQPASADEQGQMDYVEQPASADEQGEMDYVGDTTPIYYDEYPGAAFYPRYVPECDCIMALMPFPGNKWVNDSGAHVNYDGVVRKPSKRALTAYREAMRRNPVVVRNGKRYARPQQQQERPQPQQEMKPATKKKPVRKTEPQQQQARPQPQQAEPAVAKTAKKVRKTEPQQQQVRPQPQQQQVRPQFQKQQKAPPATKRPNKPNG